MRNSNHCQNEIYVRNLCFRPIVAGFQVKTGSMWPGMDRWVTLIVDCWDLAGKWNFNMWAKESFPANWWNLIPWSRLIKAQIRSKQPWGDSYELMVGFAPMFMEDSNTWLVQNISKWNDHGGVWYFRPTMTFILQIFIEPWILMKFLGL